MALSRHTKYFVFLLNSLIISHSSPHNMGRCHALFGTRTCRESVRARAREEERALAPPSPAPQEHHPRAAAADSTATGMSPSASSASASPSSPDQFPEASAPPPPPPPPLSFQPQRTRVREALSGRAQPVPGDARSTPLPPRSSENAARLASPTSSLEDVVVVGVGVNGGAIASEGRFPAHPRQHARTGSAHRAVFEALTRLLPVRLPLPSTKEEEEEEEGARGGTGGRLEAAGAGAGRMQKAAIRCGRQCQGYIRSLQQGIQVLARPA